MFFALMMMLTASVSANAMSYEQARNEALFLTDKMAYELNLTDEQYEAAYEINLDYLMGVTSRYDVYGTYWERRNLDLSYILLDWQWDAFVAASYFYRPLYWDAGYWHFGIYARYPYRDYFYFGRPHFYHTYHGAHAWHRVGGPGYYHGHSNHYRAPHREHVGMHDRWDRGDYRGSTHRHSSTRVTAGHRGNMDRGSIDGRHSGSNRGIERRGNSMENRNNRGVERRDPSRSVDSRSSQMHQRVERGNSGLSNSHRSSTYSGSSRSNSSFSGSSRNGGSFSGSSRSHSSFSGSRSGGSFSGSRSGGSFSGSHSSSSRSTSSFGGSHSSSSRSGGSFSSSHSGGGHSSSFGSSSHSHSGGGGHSSGGHSGGGGSRMGGRR